MKRYVVVITLITCATMGCAYFNTLYHARKFYREAERAREKAPEGDLPAQAGDLYLKAAEKCAKVITQHPNSRWVDDALLLMGNCFYRRMEYERALKKYDELLRLFPQSSLKRETSFMKGMVLWHLERYPEAHRVFSRAVETEEKKERKLRSWIMRGRCELAMGEEEAAIGTFREILAWPQVGDGRTEARFWLGESLIRAGRTDEAKEELLSTVENSRRSETLPEIELRLGELLEEMGEYDEAASYYEELAANEIDLKRKHELELRMADLELSAGRPEAALSRLQEIVDGSPGTGEAAEAQYHIGLILQRDLRDYDAALEAYDRVREIAPGAQATRDAAEERRVILELQRYQEKLAELDSTRTEEIAENQFLLAETLLLQFDDAEGALEHYRKAQLASPEGEIAPRALLAESWILRNRMNKADESLALLRQVATDYPATTQAARARQLLEDAGEVPPPWVPPPEPPADELLEEGPVPEVSIEGDSLAVEGDSLGGLREPLVGPPEESKMSRSDWVEPSMVEPPMMPPETTAVVRPAKIDSGKEADREEPEAPAPAAADSMSGTQEVEEPQ